MPVTAPDEEERTRTASSMANATPSGQARCEAKLTGVPIGAGASREGFCYKVTMLPL